jgi:transcriptional regulator with XRE-family HTH domain
MAAGYDDPAVQRRRLRVELKKARQDAGKTQQQVAEAMDWSVSKLVRIENSQVTISRNDLRALLELYEITDKRKIDTLLEVARIAREESWSDFREVLSPAFLMYLAFESSAWIIRHYQPFFVPGVLQTEEYAWAVQTEASGASPQTAERRWVARQRRQKLHERDKPPKMFFILDEAVIRRPVGGPGVMRRQLQRLKDSIAEDHISLQILPLGVGAYEGMGVPFVLLEFQNPNDDDVLYLEHAIDRMTRDDPDETGPYLTRFLNLEKKIALSPTDSEALLDRVISEIDPAAADMADGAKSPQEATGGSGARRPAKR